MGLILDSSVLISGERGGLDWEKLLSRLDLGSPYISAITLSELWHGYHRGKAPHLQKRLEFIRKMESLLPVLSFSTSEALIHASIWAELEKTGQRIGDHDLIIAATALANGYPVATLNENEFKRVPGLRLVSLKPFLLK